MNSAMMGWINRNWTGKKFKTRGMHENVEDTNLDLPTIQSSLTCSK